MADNMESVIAFPPATRVLVTGATGFTGAALARRLCAQGVHVRALARASSDIGALRDLPIEWVRGEVFDARTAETAVRGRNYIFHLAAAYRTAGLPDEAYRRVHVDGTRALAEAAVAQADIQRFIHVSTVGVHGHIERPPADEHHPFQPGDIYQRTKAEAELWLRDFAARRGLPFAVIRPAAIYGPGDRRLLKVFKWAARPLFPILGSGKCLYHLIHVDDLVEGLLLAAVHPAARDEIFICGNPEAVTLEQMGRWIAGALGRTLHPVRLPVWPFYAAAAVCEALCRPLRLEPLIYRRRVAFFTKDRAFDTRKIRDRLGFRTRYTNEEGVRLTAQWYRAQGWI
jgi:nucleoside-diphosphate-sugar epimerase